MLSVKVLYYDSIYVFNRYDVETLRDRGGDEKSQSKNVSLFGRLRLAGMYSSWLRRCETVDNGVCLDKNVLMIVHQCQLTRQCSSLNPAYLPVVYKMLPGTQNWSLTIARVHGNS